MPSQYGHTRKGNLAGVGKNLGRFDRPSSDIFRRSRWQDGHWPSRCVLAGRGQNGIADRIKSVGPLLLNGFHLIEQADVLEHGTQEVRHVGEIDDLVLLESFSGRRADIQNPNRAFLTAKRHRDQLGNPGFGHPAPDLGVLLVFKQGNAVILRSIGISDAVREADMMPQVRLGKPTEAQTANSRGIAFALKQPDHRRGLHPRLPIICVRTFCSSSLIETDWLLEAVSMVNWRIFSLIPRSGCARAPSRITIMPIPRLAFRKWSKAKRNRRIIFVGPLRAIQAVQPQERKSPGQQFAAVPVAGTGGAPENPPGS